MAIVQIADLGSTVEGPEIIDWAEVGNRQIAGGAESVVITASKPGITNIVVTPPDEDTVVVIVTTNNPSATTNIVTRP
jgi:hypothetical protein